MDSDSNYLRRRLEDLLEDLEAHDIDRELAYRDLSTVAGKLPYMDYQAVRDDISAPRPDDVEDGPLQD